MFKQYWNRIEKLWSFRSTSAYLAHLRKTGMRIGEGTEVFARTTDILIDTTRPWLIEIGRNVQLTAGVKILTHGYDWAVLKAKYGDIYGSAGKVTIGDDCFIGMNALILKGTTIGDRVIVGAGSVVAGGTFPSDCVIAGNPARVICTLEAYRAKRAAAQLAEAKQLVTEYQAVYGRAPDKSVLSEFFWLFKNAGRCKCLPLNRKCAICEITKRPWSDICIQNPCLMGILRFWTIAFPTRRSKTMLKLFYITKNPAVARIAQAAGVDRIFVDMEYIGKAQRQGGMDTVQNHHTVEDVARLRPVLDQAELLVRVNPVHPGSKDEIDRVVAAGADVIMLPMWQSVEQVRQFIRWVDGRAKTLLLLENQAAVDCLDRVVALPGVDEIHIGLNDLSISQGKKFLFQPLADGTVDAVCAKIKAAGIPFGFGGFGRLGGGTLPAAYIVAEHYRLGSSMSILSRAFCNTAQITDLKEIKRIFTSGVAELRQYEAQLSRAEDDFFALQHKKLQDCVEQIVEGM